MKMHTSLNRAPIRLLAVVLMALGSAITAVAAAPALQGQLMLRPLTPQEIKDYGLTNVPTAHVASGLSTLGVGQPAYFDLLVANAVPAADITNITWVLTNTPAGSAAALADGPLGTNVPPFRMADRFNSSGSPVLKVADRKMLRPDVVGQYTVIATIRTGASGTTNVTQTVNASGYMGINTCALCHSGGQVAPNTMTPWSGTLHSRLFTESIDGRGSNYFNAASIAHYTVGHDSISNVYNGGFDDVARTNGWTFPAVLTNGNWAALPSQLKNLANVQCESCHGPGSQHAFSLGNTNLISINYGAGNCAQCHDDLDSQTKITEWNNSKHAVATRTPSGPNRMQCVRCHTAPGFRNFIAHAGDPTPYATNTVYEAITCAACHDPHDATNPHQLRAANIYTLPEGTTITNAGFGALCMQCHHSRNGAATQNIANYRLGLPTWAGGSSFGVHDSTAGDMIEGVNAITYGKTIPSGAHSYTIPNVCVGCHMQPVARSDPAFGKAGGHSFSMTYKEVSGGVTNVIPKVDVCVKCHGPMNTFDMVRKDYDGDGIIDGIQTEVQHLLDSLSRLLPNSTYQANTNNYVADGLVKSSISVKTNWPVKFLNAAWNWQFVNVEGSHGIHNAPYAIGVLKASIADLTGDANDDGLPDSWQTQYFGSANSANAAPNATPAGDGVPNWLKYNLGLDPNVPGLAVPGGVVWVNGKNLLGSTNDTLAIYTAAEIAFDTVVGTSYQIQGISAIGGTWQNIGGPIAGTGGSISYVTPTRSNAQQFFRVLHTP